MRKHCRVSIKYEQLLIVGVVTAISMTPRVGLAYVGQDVLGNIGKALEKGVQDVGKTVEKGAQDAGKTVEKGAQDAGKTVEKGVQDVGKTVEKGAQDIGHTTEKAVQDTGKTIEKAAHDTGHALEKAGQDIGHFLKQATNFDLSCNLPSKKPAALQDTYVPECGTAFDTYAHDLDTCNQAGGASLIAMTTSGAAVAAGAVSFGVGAAATYALAKVAFELCQNACNSQRTMNSCVASFDTKAQQMAGNAEASARKNKEEEAMQILYRCVDSGYVGEKMLIMDTILMKCEQDKSCNTENAGFGEAFVKKVNRLNANIEVRRKRALSKIKAGAKHGLFYGPTSYSNALQSIKVTTEAEATSMICSATTPRIVAKLDLKSPVQGLSASWYRDGKLIVKTNPPSDSLDVRLPFDLKNQGVGRWRVLVTSGEGQAIGAFAFIYRPEPEIK